MERGVARRMPLVLTLALAGAGLGSSRSAAAEPPSVPCGTAEGQSLSLRLRDAYTGRAVQGASIRVLSAAAGATCRLGRTDRARLALGPGAQPLRIEAPGYRALEIHPLLEAGKDQSTSAWLGPLELPPSLRPAWVASQGRAGQALLHGHVVDAETGAPLAGVRLRTSPSQREARTDVEGYFLMRLPLPASGVPFVTEDLQLEAPGHRGLTLEGLQVSGPDLHLPLELKPGTGDDRRPESPHPLQQAAPHDEAEGAWSFLGEGPHPSSQVEGDLTTWDPPASINVDGYGWIALEDYVANGLDNEWISSWTAHSLRAGAIAYRGYGAWYQANSGHICASTSCQVYVPGSSASTIAAAQYTAGILIERNSALARSEYSAENNNFTSSGCTSAGFSCSAGSPLPCASGQAGGTSWSCLADSHSFASGPGSCCFGHGRGMCQWGTRAWATAGSTWAWMVNHYYNDMGAGSGLRTMYMTTPVKATSANGPGGSVSPGGSFVVNASVANRSAAAHTHVLFRTQLYAAGPGFVQNQAAPTAPSLPANSDTPVSATFTVPAAAPGGAYFVVVELWFDVNENGILDPSVDLRLHQLTGGTVTVSSSSNNAFAGAQVLTGLPVRGTGSNVGATKEAGEPNHGGNVGGASAWWSWTAPYTVAVSISTAGSSFDTLLAVYTGPSVASLTLVAQNDDNTAQGGGYQQSRVQFTAQGGSNYRIAVDGYNSGSGAATGSVALRLHPAPTADLNADGRTDLLLWNGSAGALSTWTMDESGARVAELALSPSGPASASWQVVGTNDFNGDQKTDLVYWDSSTGQVQFWLMNGTSRIGSPVALGGASPLATSWRVVATGDFNRDGWPDLLWRDTATYKLVVWVMSATNRTSSIAPVPDQAVDANWAVAGALDYDGDGARDLLWYNATTGKIVFWFMNASVQRISAQFASPTNAGDNNWKVVAAGDYGIGTGGVPDSNDVLWRNATSGRLVLWFMNTVGVRTHGAFTSPDSPANALGTTVVGPK